VDSLSQMFLWVDQTYQGPMLWNPRRRAGI
jgi:hypothetical protein